MSIKKVKPKKCDCLRTSSNVLHSSKYLFLRNTEFIMEVYHASEERHLPCFEVKDHMVNNNHILVLNALKTQSPVDHFSSCFLQI